MSLNLELLEQRIANLEAKKDELKGENAELKNENVKLKQIIEKNVRRDAENAKHKCDISAENAKLKAELAKLRYDFDSSNLTKPQQPQHVTNVQNLCSVEEYISLAKPKRRFTLNDIPDLMRHLRKALVMGLGRRIGKRNCCMNQLPRTYLAGVSNETTSSVIKDKKSQSHKKRQAENIVQDVFDFTATSVPEKNHMTEISMTARHEKSDMDNPPNILQNLACLIQKAWDEKDEAILANQKELLCWCSYIIEFNKKITEFMTEYKIGEKKAKGMIYDNLIKLLRPGAKRNTLLKQTQKNPNTELPDDWDGTIIDFEEDILIDQDNVLEEQAKPLVLVAQAELEKIGCQDKGGAPIHQPETLYDSEDFDYYGINDETLCPLCKLDYDDEEGINETGYEPWQLSEDCFLINSKPENKVSYLSFSEQCEEKGSITFEAKLDPELIIKSVLKYFPYLNFGNSFKGIDNYDFTSLQP
ncbi:hypothetical protein RhiirC2_849703 [Rhizophagus irregularis]|uniref:Uncharacterized protein n=1 Tax=Rhizophagus irregularis TaxID=588596 RepID=A0A2N1N9T3_9GLOM|nr:hypothetical protein RhiirC2_849703 [Rhizophagus irregularis]